MRSPSFRAGWTKHAIQGINRSAHRASLRRQVGEVTLTEVRRSSMLDWLPVAVQRSVADAVHEVLGVGEARAFWQERMRSSFETKLMGPIVGGSTLMFGDRLYACLKMGIYAYRLIARDAGTLGVEQRQGHVAMVFADLPPALVQSSGWQALVNGQIRAVAAYAGHPDVEIGLADVTTTGCVYRIEP